MKTSTGPRPSRGYNPTTSNELPAERTATSQVFQNEDGTRTRRLYDTAVYARRADGTWAAVELNLATDGTDRIAPKLGPYRMSFAPAASGGNLATVAVEAIVVRSAETPSTFDFELRLRGLAPALDSATGDVTLADEKRVGRAVIPAGWMRDAKGVESRGVRYQLRHAGQDWVLRVRPARGARTIARRRPYRHPHHLHHRGHRCGVRDMCRPQSGDRHYVRALAKELGPRGITVNAVGPRPI